MADTPKHAREQEDRRQRLEEYRLAKAAKPSRPVVATSTTTATPTFPKSAGTRTAVAFGRAAAWKESTTARQSSTPAVALPSASSSASSPAFIQRTTATRGSSAKSAAASLAFAVTPTMTSARARLAGGASSGPFVGTSSAGTPVEVATAGPALKPKVKARQAITKTLVRPPITSIAPAAERTFTSVRKVPIPVSGFSPANSTVAGAASAPRPGVARKVDPNWTISPMATPVPEVSTRVFPTAPSSPRPRTELRLGQPLRSAVPTSVFVSAVPKPPTPIKLPIVRKPVVRKSNLSASLGLASRLSVDESSDSDSDEDEDEGTHELKPGSKNLQPKPQAALPVQQQPAQKSALASGSMTIPSSIIVSSQPKPPTPIKLPGRSKRLGLGGRGLASPRAPSKLSQEIVRPASPVSSVMSSPMSTASNASSFSQPSTPTPKTPNVPKSTLGNMASSPYIHSSPSRASPFATQKKSVLVSSLKSSSPAMAKTAVKSTTPIKAMSFSLKAATPPLKPAASSLKATTPFEATSPHVKATAPAKTSTPVSTPKRTKFTSTPGPATPQGVEMMFKNLESRLGSMKKMEELKVNRNAEPMPASGQPGFGQTSASAPAQPNRLSSPFEEWNMDVTNIGNLPSVEEVFASMPSMEEMRRVNQEHEDDLIAGIRSMSLAFNKASPTSDKLEAQESDYIADLVACHAHLCETMKTRPWEFYLKQPIVYRVVDAKTGNRISEEVLPRVDFELFSLDDAVAAAEAGDESFARTLFTILASESVVCDGTTVNFSLTKHGKTRHQKTPTPASPLFWCQWAKCEEKWGKYDNVISVFEEAARRNVDDFKVTRDALRDFLARRIRENEGLASPARHNAVKTEFSTAPTTPVYIRESPVHADEDQDSPNSTPSSNSNPLNFLAYRDQLDEFGSPSTSPNRPTLYFMDDDLDETASCTDQDSEAESLAGSPRRKTVGGKKSTPHPARKSSIVKDIISMFEKIKIDGEGDDDMETQPRSGKHNVRFFDLTKAKGAFGTPLKTMSSDDQKGLITVLKPVRANKQERDCLGVDKVITPVRRSTRNVVEEGGYWTPNRGHQTPVADDSKENSKPVFVQLNEFLRCHDWAFVPNKNLPFSMQRTPSKSMGMMTPNAKISDSGDEEDAPASPLARRVLE